MEKEFQILEQEQARALSKEQRPAKFARLIEDFLQFRRLAVEELRDRYGDRFVRSELGDLADALLGYALESVPVRLPEGLMFQRFHGRWRGEWRQGDFRQAFDHFWGPPLARGGLILQRVEIGEWDGEKRSNPTPAINAYDPESGWVSGAVGLRREDPASGTAAPHWGIPVDENTLIWIARFEEEAEPHYSVYYERISAGKPASYRIRGIGFGWKPETAGGRLVAPVWKEGLYHRIGSMR